jgi:TonB family protein
LINRALAQLAGDALDDARDSLQAAEDAGANPLLVADLRREVDSRQRLISTRAGRFEELYPIDQLVAISQEPPLVPRNAPTGAELSVEVRFTVSERGDVQDIELLGNPPENLAQAVQRAVRDWRFEPVLYDGQPMPVRSSVRFTFRN